MRPEFNISQKANRVLNIILLAFLLIFIRVWYLSFIQHDLHVEKALKPQRKTIVDKAERATIRDRFNIPMAINKIHYNASVRYADLRQIPSTRWKKDPAGNKVREPVRSNYIQALAIHLGEELNMDPVQIEDTIHAKASLFPHTPFIIKEGLLEEEYYRLKLQEKDWIGIEAQKSTKRIYPHGKVGCDIVGYLGSISQNQYVKIAEELRELTQYLEKRDQGEVALLPEGFNNPVEARARLKELQEKAYNINDHIGKTGIENVYEETLRGWHGKKIFEVDRKGNCLRSLPSSKKSASGQRVLLAISSELQEYAEGLLAHNEGVRQNRDPDRMIGIARPWIMGGAIVAIDPNTGETLALASYPRFDPNDFIPAQMSEQKKQKQSSIARWIENESFVGDLWDGKALLERERYSLNDLQFYIEKEKVNWTSYLDTILPPKSMVKKSIEKIDNTGTAIKVVSSFEKLLDLTGRPDPRVLIQTLYNDPVHTPVKKTILQEEKDLITSQLSDSMEEKITYKLFLDQFLEQIKHNDDKLLLLDLCRLALMGAADIPSMFSQWQNMPLKELHQLNQSLQSLQSLVYENIQKIHHQLDFAEWRKDHFKEYLKHKRKEEKEQKKHVRPYTEYLEQVERSLFKQFWHTCSPVFIASMINGRENNADLEYPRLASYIEKILQLKEQNHSLYSPLIQQLHDAFKEMNRDEIIHHIKHMHGFPSLSTPLWGRYRMLRQTNGEQQLKHLAGAFYPLTGYGYGRSQAFRQAASQGSVFKLVVAYEALRQKYHYLLENQLQLSQLNPLTLVDQLRSDQVGTSQQILGYTLNGEAIRRFYKGGKLPRSHANIGSIDVRGALEQSSNLYFSYLAAEHIQEPCLLEQAAKNFGFGSKTGIALPGEITGNIPKDLNDNRTGLYSFAIGQHSLVVTPLQTSVMLSAIANKGKVLKPKIVKLTAGKKNIAGKNWSSLDTFPMQQSLSLIGIHFPLFTEALMTEQEDAIEIKQTEVQREIFLPPEIRSFLLEGMQKVINGSKGTARPNVIKALWTHPKIMQDYISLRDQLIGKTGTAETLYKQWIDSESKAEIINNIWFGGISFHQDAKGNTLWDNPEMAIAIYLRFSDTGGKEAAPLAAQMVAKWREICAKHKNMSHFILPSLSEEEKQAE